MTVHRPRPLWLGRIGLASVAAQPRLGAGSGCRWSGRVGRRSRRTGGARPGEDASGDPFDTGGKHPGRVGGLPDDSGPVGLVAGEGFAGPVAGDQDAATAAAEMFSIMGFAGTAARDQAWPGWSGWMP